MSKHLENIPPLENHPYEWAWNLHPNDPMCIVIYHWSQPVMMLGLHEAIESSSRTQVLKHIEECDRTPWLRRWQEERNHAIMNALTRDYADL